MTSLALFIGHMTRFSISDCNLTDVYFDFCLIAYRRLCVRFRSLSLPVYDFPTFSGFGSLLQGLLFGST